MFMIKFNVFFSPFRNALNINVLFQTNILFTPNLLTASADASLSCHQYVQLLLLKKLLDPQRYTMTTHLRYETLTIHT